MRYFNWYLNQLILKMEKINILKNKLKNGKCSYSKCQTLVQENIENFRKTKEKEAPNKKRQVRLAEEALKNLLTMKEKGQNQNPP